MSYISHLFRLHWWHWYLLHFLQPKCNSLSYVSCAMELWVCPMRYPAGSPAVQFLSQGWHQLFIYRLGSPTWGRGAVSPSEGQCSSFTAAGRGQSLTSKLQPVNFLYIWDRKLSNGMFSVCCSICSKVVFLNGLNVTVKSQTVQGILESLILSVWMSLTQALPNLPRSEKGIHR